MLNLQFKKKCHRKQYRCDSYDECDHIKCEDDIDSKLLEKSALIVAVENDNDDIVRLLLNNPEIKVNAVSKLSRLDEVEGWEDARYHGRKKEKTTIIEKPALYIAVQNNNIEIIKLLLQHPDIDINLRYINKKIIEYYQYSKVKKTALHLAIEKDNVDISKLLLQNKNIDVNALLSKKGKIIEDNNEYEEYNDDDDEFDEEKFFNDDYVKREYRDYEYIFQKQVALHMAVQNKKIEIVKLLLLNSKIDVNIQFKSSDEEKDGKTALHFAVANEDYEIIKLLLENQSIDVNIKDSQGNTPIELTKSERIKEMILNYE